MELQLLVILAVALLVFGPEKMMQFAVELGKFLRKAKQEWAKIQMELELQELKREMQRRTEEGEEKVRKYLFGESETSNSEGEGDKKTDGEKGKSKTLEDLVKGNSPVLEEDKNRPERR